MFELLDSVAEEADAEKFNDEQHEEDECHHKARSRTSTSSSVGEPKTDVDADEPAASEPPPLAAQSAPPLLVHITEPTIGPTDRARHAALQVRTPVLATAQNFSSSGTHRQ